MHQPLLSYRLDRLNQGLVRVVPEPEELTVLR
jgi:hypothetical protein